MTRSEWLKTPYAGTEAKDPDRAIQQLLDKYGVRDIQWTIGTGPEGRRAAMLRFILDGKGYRLMLETLEADAKEIELLRQVKRAIFYTLKAALESARFFGPEKTLFAFLELPNGQTMHDAAALFMDRLAGPDFGRLMLSPPEHPQSVEE